MADKDYLSFDEVMKNLKLEEDELKRLVSAGEIRAFRDKNTMRFKAEDVRRLSKAPAADDDLELDTLDLELDDELTLDAPAEEDAVLELDEPAELVLEGEDATVEELDLGGGDELELEPEESAPAAGGRRGKRAAAATAEAAPTTSRRSARAGAEAEPMSEGAGVVTLLVLGLLVLLIANFVLLDAVTGSASNALSRAVANMFS